MQSKYDFSRGVRGKHFRSCQRGANVVVLAPEVVKAFPNASAVNDSIRVLANGINQQGETITGRHQI